jgi:hypothetical protein
MVMRQVSFRGTSKSAQQYAGSAGKYYHASPSATSLSNFPQQLPSTTSVNNFRQQLPSTTSVNNFAHLDAAHDEIEPQISDT